MVLRSVVVLVSAVVVGTSPSWLNAVGAWLGVETDAALLPFSMYWIAAPGAIAVAISWVIEMGAKDATPAPAGEFDWTKSVPDQVDRRGVPSESPKSGDSTSVWRRLETDFREIQQSGADFNATWKRTSSYGEASETWRVSANYQDESMQKKFAELSETAGRMLVEWTGYTPPLAPATARQSTPQNRWFCVLRDREIKTEVWAPGQIMQNENITGHIHGGMIRGVIDASVELCVQLTLEESLEDRSQAAEKVVGPRIVDAKQAQLG